MNRGPYDGNHMPKTKTAKKALRQNARRRVRNLSHTRTLREALKAYRTALAGGKKEEITSALSRAYQVLDKLAKTGVIKPGKASRTKSRMAKAAGKKAGRS